jgi:hypothetical protein
MAAELIVTDEVPLEVKVNVLVVEAFTVTLPNASVAAPTVNCGFAAAVPVPLRDMTDGFPVDDVLLMVSCPVAAPAAVGANCTCTVAVWVGFKVTGKVPPTIVKPAPLMFAEFTITGAVPLDVNVNV